jgi:hypothetical protein
MKVEGPGRARPGAVVNKKERTRGASGDFAQTVRDTNEPHEPSSAAVTGVSPLSAIDALLPLQEVNTATDGRAKGLERGEDILDRLEEIRMGLLLGRVPLDRLKDLLRLVDSRRTAFTDPKLTAILDEIELRAKVELAKLGQI